MTGPRLSDQDLERLWAEYQASQQPPRQPVTPPVNRGFARAAGVADSDMARYTDMANEADPVLAARRRLQQGLPSESTGTRATVRNASPSQVASNRASDAALVKGVLRQLGQGAAFGFADEIEGGARAAFGPDDYRTARDRVRAENAAFSAEHPVISAASNLVGGVASGAGLARAATSLPALASLGLAPKAQAGASALARAGQAAKLGGVGGAITGAGLAPEMEDVVPYMAGGGAAGATLGAGLSAVGGAVRGARNLAAGLGQGADEASGPIRRAVQADDPQRKAVERVLNRMRAGGQSVDDLRAASQAAPEPAALAELIPENRGVQGLRVARNMGRERDAIDRALAERAAEEPARYTQTISDISGVREGLDPGIVREQAFQAVEPRYAELLQKAYAQPDVSAKPILKAVEKLGSLKRGREALSRASELSSGFDALQAIDPVDPVISVQNAHNLRQGLDYAIERAIEDKDGQMVRILTEQRSTIDRFVKKAGGKLMQRADRLWESAANTGESFAAGQMSQTAKTKPRMVALKMSAKDPESFRRGAASKQIEGLEAVADGAAGQVRNPTVNTVANKTVRARSSLGYETPGDFRQVRDAAEDIVNRLRTRQAVSGNSTTAANLAEMTDEFMANPAQLLSAPLSPTSWLRVAGERGLRGATQGLNARQATEMGRVLGAGLPGQMTRDEALALLEQLTPELQQQLTRSLTRTGALSRLGAGAMLR